METNTEIRILLLEDSAADAALIERALRRADITFNSMHVETRDAFVAALEQFRPDIVLADYKLPAFDGLGAVQIVRGTHPEVPVVMVTGALGDEGAVELLKAGARDYVLKDRLARLGPAVRRALAEERGIRARKQAERELARRERYYRKLIEGGTDMFLVLDRAGVVTYRNDASMKLTGYETEEVIGKHVTTFIAPENLPLARSAIAEVLKHPDQMHKVELRFLHRDGSQVDAEAIGRNLLDDPDIGGIVVTARDITEQKRAEDELKRRNEELERFNRATTDRELRMIELKRKVNELSRELGKPPPYALDFLAADGQSAADSDLFKANQGGEKA